MLKDKGKRKGMAEENKREIKRKDIKISTVMQ